MLLGPDAHLETTVLGTGTWMPEGSGRADLYLRGGGDPTFGCARLIRCRYGGVGANVGALAAQLKAHGISRVTGRL